MLLSISTATQQFSVALVKEQGALVAETTFFGGSKKFRPLMPAIHHLLGSAKTDVRKVTSLAVATGPGSFTGLRIGLSVAKGICQGLQIPIIGVSSLEAMASQLPFTPYKICPVIDSRKGEVFAALFRWSEEEEGTVRVKKDTSLRVEALPEFTEGPAVFLGNDLQTQGPSITEALGQRAVLAPPHLWTLRAAAIGYVGLRLAREKGFDDLHRLVPSYLRPPDIRPNPYGPLRQGDGPISIPQVVKPLTNGA